MKDKEAIEIFKESRRAAMQALCVSLVFIGVVLVGIFLVVGHVNKNTHIEAKGSNYIQSN